MTYVPTPIVPPTSEEPSIRARELGGRLHEVIAGYRQEHPELSDREVLQALGLARRSLRGTAGQQPMILAVALGASLLAGLVAYLFAGGAPDLGAIPWVLIAIFVGVLILLWAVLKPRG
jgi:hypothetical protein